METTKHNGAKEQSKLAMIIAALWIALGTIFKGLGFIQLEVSEIIFSGFSIAACFIPVYFSIIMDKIKDIKLGKGE